jgi:hypothetical protein
VTAARERNVIRILHLTLSIPILGYLYGPVGSIPQAAWFTRWIAMPAVLLSGLWLWLKPRIVKRLYPQRVRPSNNHLAKFAAAAPLENLSTPAPSEIKRVKPDIRQVLRK